MAVTPAASAIDPMRTLDTFLELVRIDSPSGQEQAIAERLLVLLEDAGVSCQRDETGNVLGRRAGQGRGADRAPLLLSAHMDTVQPGTGVQPVVADGVVRTSGTTILGADDKAGITAILEALRVTHEQHLDCVPVEVAFTVQEETGLFGAKALDTTQLQAKQAVVLDSNGPVGAIVNRAPAAALIKVVVHGKAAHAGVSPELGVSAIQAASRAIARMRLGRIDEETTANIGVINGGTARNVVPDRVEMLGDARSRDVAKLDAQCEHMRRLFEEEAAALSARADVEIDRSYGAIDVAPDSTLIRRLEAALHACGLTPHLMATGGGSDASIYNDRGIEAVNLGVGYRDMHSTGEHIAVADLIKIAEVTLTVLTQV